MSPRFEFDPTTVVASMEVFPKGEYEMVVGEPKAFLRQAGEDKHDSYGIRYSLVIKQPDEYDGKRTIFSTYYQSEGSQSMAKQFIMAVLGYGQGKAGRGALRSRHAREGLELRSRDWRCR
jgi:hypothetical protein